MTVAKAGNNKCSKPLNQWVIIWYLLPTCTFWNLATHTAETKLVDYSSSLQSQKFVSIYKSNLPPTKCWEPSCFKWCVSAVLHNESKTLLTRTTHSEFANAIISRSSQKNADSDRLICKQKVLLYYCVFSRRKFDNQQNNYHLLVWTVTNQQNITYKFRSNCIVKNQEKWESHKNL